MSEWIEANRDPATLPSMDDEIIALTIYQGLDRYWRGPAWKFDWNLVRESRCTVGYKVIHHLGLLDLKPIELLDDGPWYPVDVSKPCAYLMKDGRTHFCNPPAEGAVAVAEIGPEWVRVSNAQTMYTPGVFWWWVPILSDSEFFHGTLRPIEGPDTFRGRGFLHLPTFTGTYTPSGNVTPLARSIER
jgi:hypothetical protein